jgi:quercetin dioxygenase-like cupin family protein
VTDTADADVRVQSIDALESYGERSACRIIADEQVGVENVSVGTVDFTPGERGDRQFRDIEEIVVVLEGRGRVVTDDETHELAAGDAAIVSPGVYHYHENPGETWLRKLWAFAPQGPERAIRSDSPE